MLSNPANQVLWYQRVRIGDLCGHDSCGQRIGNELRVNQSVLELVVCDGISYANKDLLPSPYVNKNDIGRRKGTLYTSPEFFQVAGDSDTILND